MDSTKMELTEQGGSKHEYHHARPPDVCGASSAFIIQLADTISVMRELFGIFDKNGDGYIIMDEVMAMRSRARSLMLDIVLHGMERCMMRDLAKNPRYLKENYNNGSLLFSPVGAYPMSIFSISKGK